MEKIRINDSFVVISRQRALMLYRLELVLDVPCTGLAPFSPLATLHLPCGQQIVPRKTRSWPFPIAPASVLTPYTCVHRIPTDRLSTHPPCSVQRSLPQIPLLPLTVVVFGWGACFSPNFPNPLNAILVTDSGLSSAFVFIKFRVLASPTVPHHTVYD